MAKLIDYPCKHNEYLGLPIETFLSNDLTIPDAFYNADDIVKMAELANLHYFPLDPILEAEVLGAAVKKDHSPLGLRKDHDIITKIEQLENLPLLDPLNGRYGETIAAVKQLNAKGHQAFFEIRGPFTILSGLGDIMTILMGWRKHPDIIEAFFDQLIEGLVSCAIAAKDAGAGIIYYSDGPGSLSVLGPKYTKKVTESFTVPFLKELDKRLDDNSIVYLCPKTAFQLVGTDSAEWKKLELGETIPYSQGCRKAIGKVRFLGQRCPKNADTDVSVINYLELK